MTKNYTVEELRIIANKGKRIDIRTAFKIMEECHQHQKLCLMLFKVNEESYKKWYQENKQHLSSIEDETTYLVSQNNKAFGNYGGYSIFGTSLGQKLRHYFYDMCDRIEHCKLEYAIIVERED